jgi:hypothetical protein
MPPSHDLSPWAVALTIAAAVVGPKAAALVGAYSIILIGWFAGLLYGLYTRAPESRLPVWAYAAFTFIVCFMVTVPASLLLVRTIPGLDVEYTAVLFPVAAAIPALPDKWGSFGEWLIERWQSLRGVKP